MLELAQHKLIISRGLSLFQSKCLVGVLHELSEINFTSGIAVTVEAGDFCSKVVIDIDFCSAAAGQQTAHYGYGCKYKMF